MKKTIQVLECYECGMIMEKNPLEHEGEYYCMTCFVELFKTCSQCNEVFSRIDVIETHDSYYCEECLNDNFFMCTDCGNYVIQDDALEHEGEMYCGRCFRNSFFECENCGDVHKTNHAYIGSDDMPYCEDCYYEHFQTCDNCGVVMYRDDAYYCDGDDAYYCQGCHDENNGTSEYIHRYNYKPYDFPMHRLASEKKEKEFFGIEIEMENKNGLDRDGLDDILGNVVNESPSIFYFKEDGSLNNGFEMVSFPCSFSFLKSKKEILDRVLKKFSSEGFRSYNTSTCGLHIHVSKNSISHLALYKLLKLFYENPSFIMKVSKRKEGQFNQWSTLNERDGDDNLVIKAKTKNGFERYVAINLSNEHTIEFRIFRGTLKSDSVYKNIEFVKSTIEFCKEKGIKEITVENYFRYIQEHRNMYKHFYGYALQNFLLPTI